jgi:hypothetical protein
MLTFVTNFCKWPMGILCHGHLCHVFPILKMLAELRLHAKCNFFSGILCYLKLQTEATEAINEKNTQCAGKKHVALNLNR